MVSRLVRLIILASLLASCATRPPVPREALGMPEDDPARGTPAMALLEEAEQARRYGELSSVGRHLERALNLAPGSSWIYRQLAELRLNQGQAAAAEGFVRRALRHAPRDNNDYRASLHDLLATSLARQGKSAEADEARQRAVTLRTEPE